MYPVSSGFEEWIHLFVQDSFGQKRETLPGAIVVTGFGKRDLIAHLKKIELLLP